MLHVSTRLRGKGRHSKIILKKFRHDPRVNNSQFGPFSNFLSNNTRRELHRIFQTIGGVQSISTGLPMTQRYTFQHK